MITQDRNGNALPATVDAADLQWSCRIAYTAGDYLTPSSWTYYELPPSAILNRSRSSALDGSTWQTSLKLLAEAVPELSDVQAYYQLEIDLVDSVGNSWPYHTGPIDSITDSYEEASGATVQTKEITSFGTLQRLKNARVNGFYWDGNSQAVPSGQVFTGFAEAVNVAITTTGLAGWSGSIPGSWHTVDATLTGGTYPGIIVSPNADFSGAYTSPANYSVTATSGSQVSLTFATAPAATIYVKYFALRYFGMRGYGITFPTYSGDPTFVRIPDGRMPYGASETAPRRRITDSFSTFAAASCTSTTIYVQDPEAFKNAYSTAIVAPGIYQEILAYTASDGTEYFAPIASTDVNGVITLTTAFVTPVGIANPVPEGSPLRIVTSEIERQFVPDSTGSRTRFFTTSGGATEYTRDSFAFDAREGVLLPLRPRHYLASTDGVYNDGTARFVPGIKGTLGLNDASVESFVYRTFTDYPATDVTKFYRSADFVQGNFSGCYVKAYSAANTTWDKVLEEVTDLAAAPNVFVHDLPDGRLKVGAYSQATTPDATLDQVYSITADAIPEPVTAVAVKSILKSPVNIAGQCRNVVTTTGTLNNQAYLFDGDRSLSTTWTAAGATNLATVTMNMPFIAPETFPMLAELRIYPGGTLGAVSVKVTKTTFAGVSTTRYVNGMGYALQEASKPLVIAGQLLEEAMFLLGLDYSSRFAIVIEGRPNDGVAASAAQFSATEIELLANVGSIWVARVNDLTTSAPTGYTTLNQQGFGSIWWNQSPTKPISERYAQTAYLKRVMPQYDSAGTYRFDRMQVIEMEQITVTEARRYAEDYMDEYLRGSRSYTVSGILDPRIDLGDTVTIALDDGTNLDLFVWAIQDSGGSEDLSATYTLRDYSA